MNKKQSSKADRFKGPSKWCGYVFARGLAGLIQLLPLSVAFRLGRGVGWLCWKLLKRRRVIVRKNLEIVNAWMVEEGKVERGRGELLDAQVRELFQRSGANLFAGFPLSRLRPEQMEAHLEIEGIEHVREVLAQGKGVIMLLAHMGPWEVLAHLPQLASDHGVHAPFGAMYRPLNNTYLDNWVREQRAARNTRLFSRRDGFHKPVDFLRAGGMLGILADQKMRQGEWVSFFGVEASSTPIPGLFHRRSGAPMLALSIETVGVARWKLTVDLVDLSGLSEKPSRGALSLVCNQALEQALSRSPCDGFWLSRRF
ncbi:MAG: KDO2-lipid IV(A) lauroyltransferase [Bacteroidia bacterium]|jgi:KDO2-lipid IV(A) lauroyltransferase